MLAYLSLILLLTQFVTGIVEYNALTQNTESYSAQKIHKVVVIKIVNWQKKCVILFLFYLRLPFPVCPAAFWTRWVTYNIAVALCSEIALCFDLMSVVALFLHLISISTVLHLNFFRLSAGS